MPALESTRNDPPLRDAVERLLGPSMPRQCSGQWVVPTPRRTTDCGPVFRTCGELAGGRRDDCHVAKRDCEVSVPELLSVPRGGACRCPRRRLMTRVEARVLESAFPRPARFPECAALNDRD